MSWADGLLAVGAVRNSMNTPPRAERQVGDMWVLGIAGLGLLHDAGCPLLQVVVITTRAMDLIARNLGLELWHDSAAAPSPVWWWLDGHLPDGRSALHNEGLVVHGARLLRA
eukprot:6936083-Alexandrium_andersonii.AAC.1